MYTKINKKKFLTFFFKNDIGQTEIIKKSLQRVGFYF